MIGYLKRIGTLILAMMLGSSGIVMMVQANIGLDPWNVFHQGVSRVSGVSLGVASMVIGGAAIAVAILLGAPFGFGTMMNIFGCGALIDFYLWLGLFPKQQSFWLGLGLLLLGLEALTLATYFFIRSGLGNGPRDSLMVVLTKKTHLPIGLVRGMVEVSVTFLGWLMGGQVGVGTIVSALAIGFFLQVNFGLLHFKAETIYQESVLETLRGLKLIKAKK